MTIATALLSVSDKTGLIVFARRLSAAGVRLLSTSGTAALLRSQGLEVIEVSDLTGFPEILDGRVKTLHPKVYGGLLARRDRADDMASLAEHGIGTIDLVVVNLYPFVQAAAKKANTFADIVENIDIGGPSMLRAAAKNHAHVTVVCDPADYGDVAAAIEASGDTDVATRKRLAAKVYLTTSAYDAAITNWLSAEEGDRGSDAGLPSVWRAAMPRGIDLRYGENPHQKAAFYVDPEVDETCIARARQLQGKQLSYNNILDAEGALEMVRDFADLAPAAAVIVKHSNPCGIAIADSPAKAYERAHECDPDSAFGGIVALSTACDADTARAITATFNEIVIAPEIDAEARAIFATKKNLRVLETGPFTPKRPLMLPRGVVGGLLVCERDLGLARLDDLKLMTNVTPTEDDLSSLLFAWRCVKWVKSNAIVYASSHRTLGIGAGQMSRVDSARIGAQKSRRPLSGLYMASDAFLPFRDSVDAAAKHGIRGIIQPGGSVRDQEVIDACTEHGIVLVFTGMRHFRH